MKGIRHNKLLTLISIIVLSCNAQSASAQSARISGSAVFINGLTTTITVNTPGSNTTTSGIDASNNPFTTNTSIAPITTTNTTSGAITTVSAESSLPSGFYYASTTALGAPAFVIVKPSYTTITTGVIGVDSLSIGAGAITPVGAANSFTQAAADVLLKAAAGNTTLLTTANAVDAAAAFIKAGAGVAGLE
ncbi:MAG: hypothetical protein WCP16_25250 [Pseudanabaena sp. ELA645]|jgi:hypothetical protein